MIQEYKQTNQDPPVWQNREFAAEVKGKKTAQEVEEEYEIVYVFALLKLNMWTDIDNSMYKKSICTTDWHCSHAVSWPDLHLRVKGRIDKNTRDTQLGKNVGAKGTQSSKQKEKC